MLNIDGSSGEGGGQILRSSLGLSLVTGKPFRIDQIRANRKPPGLRTQHLTSVQAAARVGQARTEGARLGSQTLVFEPSGVHAGSYHFAMSTAGSTTLVLQTVLPALLTADGPTTLTLEGGTDNPHAPPFDFLVHAFLPLIERMGARVQARRERHGFYPAGGGKVVVTAQPAKGGLRGFELSERGAVTGREVVAKVAGLPSHIAHREIAAVIQALEWPDKNTRVEEIEEGAGPGNVLSVRVRSEHVTEVFTGFGERGVPAETVARRTAREVTRYLKAEVPVGEHLADQLLLPLALAGGGSFLTVEPSLHARTNAEVVAQFLDVRVLFEPRAEDAWLITVAPAKTDWNPSERSTQ